MSKIYIIVNEIKINIPLNANKKKTKFIQTIFIFRFAENERDKIIQHVGKILCTRFFTFQI